MNTISASSMLLAISLRLSSALFLPMSGSEPAPCPWVSFSAYLDFLVGVGHGEGLLVRIHGYKFYALGSGFDHSVDDVVAGSAHAQYLESYDILRSGFGFIRHIRCLPVIF